MKKSVFYLMSIALTLFSSISMKTEAQVTIGEKTSPHPAALLDLRTSKGLLLSKASLQDAAVFQLSTEKTREAEGMIIYNMNPNMKDGHGVGLYLWDGFKWNFMEESQVPPLDCSGPPQGISITGFERTVILNETITLVCNVTTDGITTYTWTIPQGLEVSGARDGQSITLIARATGVYKGETLRCAVANACGGGSSTVTGSLTVNNCTPATPGDINVSPSSVTKGSTFTASIDRVDRATSYKWWINDILQTSITGISTGAITATAAGNLKIEVAAVNACGESAKKTLTITVNDCTPATPGTIRFSPASPVNKNVSVTATVDAVDKATSYKWWVDNNNTPTSTTANASTTLNLAPGTYTIKVSAVSSCGESAKSNGQTLTVKDCTNAPSANLSAVSGSYDTSTTFTVTCNLTNASNAGAVTYTWVVPNGLTIVSGQNSNQITVKGTANGTHNGTTITCTVTNQCGSQTVNSSGTVNILAPGGGEVDGYERYCYTMSSGKTCWMTKNSRLGTPSATAYTNSGTTYDNVGYYYSYENAIKKTGQQYDVCPQGWTLPTLNDFTELQTYLNKTGTPQTEKDYWLRDKDKDGFHYTLLGVSLFMGYHQYSGFFGNGCYILGSEDNTTFLDYEPRVVRADDNSLTAPDLYYLSVRCVKKLN